jgi:hypothetical protein
MKTVRVAVLAVLVVLALVSASMATTFEQISVTSGAVVTFTATKIGPPNQYAVAAACSLTTGSIRWTSDGTTPTSTVGHLMAANEQITLLGAGDVNNFKAIAVSTTGVLSCSYYPQNMYR